MKDSLIIRLLGTQAYLPCLHAMQVFTQNRNENTLDELWLLEHPPIFTLGQNGKPEHILESSQIPIVKVDRGGQVTYHGPGQTVIYALIDLKRKKWNIRDIISLLEKSVILFLSTYQIKAESKREAPGIYINEKKIGSIGLRIKRGCSYHGMAININMDLNPFKQINPCGYKALQMTQLSEFLPTFSQHEIQEQLINYLMLNLGYTKSSIKLELADGN